MPFRLPFILKQLGFHWTDFHVTWCLRIFRKTLKDFQNSLKSDKKIGTLHKHQCKIFISLSLLLRVRNGSDKIRRENRKTHFHNFLLKWRRLRENVEKYCEARQAALDNMARVHCMLDTQGYRHTLRLCNTYYLSTAAMFARTRLNVTLTQSSCLFILIFNF
jgi:hypothetical protein